MQDISTFFEIYYFEMLVTVKAILTVSCTVKKLDGVKLYSLDIFMIFLFL